MYNGHFLSIHERSSSAPISILPRLKSSFDKGDRRRAKSILGKLSLLILGCKRDNIRTSLSLKWHRNRGNFQNKVRYSSELNGNKSSHEVDTYQSTVEYICSQLESDTCYSIDDEIHISALNISVESIERDKSNNRIFSCQHQAVMNPNDII